MKNITKKKICFVSGGLDVDPDIPSVVVPGVTGGGEGEGGENEPQAPYVPPLSPRIYFEPKTKVTETPGTPDPPADEDPETPLGELPPPANNSPFREPGNPSDNQGQEGAKVSDLAAVLQNGKIKRAKFELDNGKTVEISEKKPKDSAAPTENEAETPEDSWTILGWTWKKKYWMMSGAGLLVLLVVLIILATKKN